MITILGRIKETAAVDSWRRNGILEKSEFANEINSALIGTVRLTVAIGSGIFYRSKFNVLGTPGMIEWE
ncbi:MULTISPECIES: hypothetical protein [unclassified Devosia]|uniref:hypothetical protein n=1 Tax=unclassified Devosia TaxID=196773 RepID=UPI001AD3340B|nr:MULTISPECIES: hypothetical protein [unclassified Devosia]MBN9307503.1 hypothetical protein [Devosia sp.]